MLGEWTITGAGSGSCGTSAAGLGGGACIGDGGVGRGDNLVDGWGRTAGASEGCDRGGIGDVVDGVLAGAGSDCVVKAPTALQSLRVSAVMALTFQ